MPISVFMDADFCLQVYRFQEVEGKLLMFIGGSINVEGGAFPPLDVATIADDGA